MQFGLDTEQCYRAEALGHRSLGYGRDYLASAQTEPPVWLTRAPRFIFLLVVLYFALACLLTVDEYTTVPAIIYSRVRYEARAPKDGIVQAVLVSMGQRITRGTALVSIRPISARKPGVADLQIKTIAGGIVKHIEHHPGELVRKGDPIITIVDASSGYEVSVCLYRSDYDVSLSGRRIVFTTNTPDRKQFYSRLYTATNLTRNHPLRYGSDPEGAKLHGVPQRITVKAPLTCRETDRCQDGMIGTADVSARSERFIFILLPSLKTLIMGVRQGT